MGKGEMECPVELWVSEPNGPGHPNEEILSALQAVRTFFHHFLSRPLPLFADLDEFIRIFFSKIPSVSDLNLSQLKRCSEFLHPLTELLGTGENSAPDRLLRILLPQSNPLWALRSPKKATINQTDGTYKDEWAIHSADVTESDVTIELTLEYSIRMREGHVRKSMSAEETEDFQSSLILAQTDKRSSETTDAIQGFVEGFSWMKGLRDVLAALKVCLQLCE